MRLKDAIAIIDGFDFSRTPTGLKDAFKTLKNYTTMRLEESNRVVWRGDVHWCAVDEETGHLCGHGVCMKSLVLEKVIEVIEDYSSNTVLVFVGGERYRIDTGIKALLPAP